MLNRKNTIDPETMIKQYGADAVRWFILSDSPPEKDVQWSNVGVTSANKFLQKVWNLNFLISQTNKKDTNKILEEKFTREINTYIYKIDASIKEFRFNVSIALFYELYNFINKNVNTSLNSDVLKKSLIDIMKLMIPLHHI